MNLKGMGHPSSVEWLKTRHAPDRWAATGRLTFTTWHHVKKDSPLLVSGLLGPVTLRTAEIIPAK